MGRKIGDRRSFVVNNASVGSTKPGRYIATSPFGAARKAALKLFKLQPSASDITFTLREITRQTVASNQVHAYAATKTEENPPRIVKKVIKDKETGSVVKTIEYPVSVKIEVKSQDAASPNAQTAT
jgi:hypothetical protein